MTNNIEDKRKSEWFLLRTVASSVHVGGLVKISKSSCSECGHKIVKTIPKGKANITVVNSKKFDIDFCIFDGATVYKDSISSIISNWRLGDAAVRKWSEQNGDDASTYFVISNETLPRISLQAGKGTTLYTPCPKCSKRTPYNILYDYDIGPTVRQSDLEMFDIFIIDGMCELLISERVYRDLQPLVVGSTLTSFVPAELI